MPEPHGKSRYNREQAEALISARDHLALLSSPEERSLRMSLEAYLEFRDRTARFQEERFSGTCTLRCFGDGTSACCGREGILTFFADVAINVLLSTEQEVESLLSLLARDRGGPNCVYLGEGGCAWRLKPITCEMFLCDRAKEDILGKSEPLTREWEELRRQERLYTFPDRPVLFDGLEKFFLDAGIESSLMYCHKSPGMMLLKKKHGVGKGG